MRRLFARAGLAAALALAPAAVDAANYDESVLGDVSSIPATPSTWNLEAGANVLKGSAGASSDYDLLTFVIPAGHRLDTLFLDEHQIQGYASFLGIQSGATWTAGLGWSVDGTKLLGWDLFDAGSVGTDRLPQIALNGNTEAQQFTPPLGSGTYTLLLQDVQTPFSYQFTFNVSEVPEPTTLGLAAIGLLAMGRMARRK
jgi:opacity protein-like surface antigen